MTLYHYTCTDHGLPGIARAGLVRPIGQLVAMLPPGMPSLAWFTDLTDPDAAALGLTGLVLACDRTAARIEVEEHPGLEPWCRWRRANPAYKAFAAVLEAAPGARPAHWWVSSAPVPVKELP